LLHSVCPGGPGMGRSQSGRGAPRKDPTQEMTVGLSLEEMYSGLTKKMKITRNVSYFPVNVNQCLISFI
jgi:DnaJ-class molecular chaperone